MCMKKGRSDKNGSRYQQRQEGTSPVCEKCEQISFGGHPNRQNICCCRTSISISFRQKASEKGSFSLDYIEE